MSNGARAVALCASWCILASSVAHASDPRSTEPQVETEDNGTLVARVVVDASVAAVRAIVDDPSVCGFLTPDVLDVQHVRAGDCFEVTTQTRGMFRPLKFRTLRCLTSDGWQEKLVASEDFSEVNTSWHVREVEGGTEVLVRMKSEVNLPVPETLVRSHSRRSLGQMLSNLAQRLHTKKQRTR